MITASSGSMRNVLASRASRVAMAVSMMLDVPGFVGEQSEAAEPGDAGAEDVVAAGVGGDDHAVAGEAGEGLADD